MRNTWILLAGWVISFNLTAQSVKINIPGIPHPFTWENKPLKFSTTTHGFTITAGRKTDMFQDPNMTYHTDNAPQLLFQADSNFVLSLSITHAFANKWDGGAIVLKSDSLNWIKFCYEKDYRGAKRVVSVVTKGISDDCNSMAMQADIIYYKVAKAGKVITLYCSEDGITWMLVRHLYFDFKPGFKVGFLAQSPEGEKCEVKFDNIKYIAKKIVDPYAGE